jgi:metal-responsive CopG/Arc/MetJ family transcriptional regulator
MVVKNLRLADLADRRVRYGSDLLSVRLPVELLARVDDLVERVGSRKADVIVALLNEGLARYQRQRVSRSRQRPA